MNVSCNVPPKGLFQWRIQGGVRGVQMYPPFEGLPSLVLSKSAQT